ncbi:unnamed protein product [Rotaria sordida]|uniref:Uncharacterized protein n=1 Tax=Rotaria sordida TaxID=392033 RepID=A0A813VJI1_9BILA|nr:unnamed protein product [Rotaria sordida]
MAYFDPVIVLFGSSKSISTINLRLPVSFVFAIDETSLEELVTVDPPLASTTLRRYFIILLESISNDVFERLQTNHRVQIIYSRDMLTYVSSHSKLPRIINKQSQQFTLDLTADIVHFFTIEGEKQEKLERLNLVRLYYRQARLLKEWAMSFAKAEPCHILLIPLNTNQKNLNNAQERLQKLCTKLNYPSVIIRTFDNYIPSMDEQSSCLLPYSQVLFHHEHPQYICELIKKLSPLRLYLYGNEEFILSEWSNLMINSETHVMEDEDNWCAFIENEYIDDEMKWNIGPKFGTKWQIKRIAPINLSELDKNLRFQSALHRAFKTLNHRQIEITAEIFDWYDRCIRERYLQLEPKVSIQQKEKPRETNISNLSRCIIRNPSSFDYHHTSESKGISFIWLDEIINSLDNNLNQIIEPYHWYFFNNVTQCIPYIENQLRQQNEIFLVVSGSLGYELFLTAYRLMSAIRFVYIYCSRLGLHENWIKYYSQIQGVFNDSLVLEEKLKKNLEQINQLENRKQSQTTANTSYEQFYDQTLVSLPILVYNQEQASAFMAHQRTIDTLLCLPHTNESFTEMIEEFRRIYNDNEIILAEINTFEETYNSNIALQWYSRDSFLFRIINRALRSSDVDMMFKMRHFLIDLYIELDNLYKQTHTFYSRPIIEKLYRGQLMSKIEFEYFKQLSGEIISINTFLSTTTSLQIALTFVNISLKHNDFIRVLFCIETNPSIQHKRPYANISNFSMFTDEDEVLFAMGSLFRILYIDKLDRINNIPVVYLRMVDQKEIDYNFLS